MERGRAKSGRERQVKNISFIEGNCSRTPPVLARGVFDFTSKKEEDSSLMSKEELEAEEETPFDNLFFTFCCGDNLTCLKDSMVRKIFNFSLDLI